MKKYFLFAFSFLFCCFFTLNSYSAITPITQTAYSSPARSNAPARAAGEEACFYEHAYNEDPTNISNTVPESPYFNCCKNLEGDIKCDKKACNLTDSYLKVLKNVTEPPCESSHGYGEFCIRNDGDLYAPCLFKATEDLNNPDMYKECYSGNFSLYYNQLTDKEDPQYGICKTKCLSESSSMVNEHNKGYCLGYQHYYEDDICEKIIQNERDEDFIYAPTDQVEGRGSDQKSCVTLENKFISSVSKICQGFYTYDENNYCQNLGFGGVANTLDECQDPYYKSNLDTIYGGKKMYKCKCSADFNRSLDAIWDEYGIISIDKICTINCINKGEPVSENCILASAKYISCPTSYKTLNDFKKELGSIEVINNLDMLNICKAGCDHTLLIDDNCWKYSLNNIRCPSGFYTREQLKNNYGFTDRSIDKYEEEGKPFCKLLCSTKTSSDPKECTKYSLNDFFPACPTIDVDTITEDGATAKYIDTTNDDGYTGDAPRVIKIESGSLAGWYTTDLEDSKVIDGQEYKCTSSGEILTFKKGANLTDANGYLFFEKSVMEDKDHCNGKGNIKSDVNSLPIVGIRLYSECKCPNHVLKSKLCNNNQLCIEQGIGNPYDVCKIAFKSNDEVVLGYTQVSCPDGFYTLSEYWNANKNSMTFDPFLEDRLEITFTDDWQKYYTALTTDATHKCEYGAIWDQAQNKPEPTDPKYNKFMLNCGVIQDKFQDIELQTEKPTTQNYVTCVERTGEGDKTKEETKYIPVCTIDHKEETYLGYETFTKTNPDPTICIFNNKKYYRNGGSCPIKFTGSEAVIGYGLSSTDLKELYGPNIVDRTCDYYGEKRTLITCDANTYTTRCVYPYIVNSTISQSYCRRAQNGEQISLNSPMYYDNSSGNACMFEPSICGEQTNSEDTELGSTEFRFPVVSAQSCAKLYGPAAKGEQCITSGGELTYQCYWSTDFSLTSCPLGSDMTRPYIIENGVKKWDSCHCAIAYKYHKFNCNGLKGASCRQAGRLSAEFLAERNDPTLNTFSSDVDFYAHCDQPLDEYGNPIVITPPPPPADEEGSAGTDDGTGSESGDDTETGDETGSESGDGTGAGTGTGTGTGSGTGTGTGSGVTTQQQTWAVCYYCCPYGMTASGKTKTVNGTKQYECVYK